ncbi:hypothetical protein PVL29_017629 [Vitis rotundifolia]|uniref:Uncharacterized protein n=1 Tax=Vitis rotundifolia TaxID=103349 RepID=A0AA38ZB71_VITRO|nr:hypothetical protein PVL29_017629 [Vitis rotundifolia]
MAAALLIGKTFHTKNRSIQELRDRPNPRIPTFLCCQNQGDIDELESKTVKGKENRPLVLRVFAGVAKFGEGLRENLSPKQKGDWKDLVLMSLSFAVYVYMSQRIVCAYCVWMSMVKQPW